MGLIMKNRVLVLMNARFEIDRYYIKYGNRDNLKISSIYKIYKKGLTYKIAALWMQKLHFPFQALWYSDWKQEVGNYDVIIVSALNLSWKVLEYIRKKNPNVRLIVWFWDSINNKVFFDNKYNNLCEVWSFDKADCQRYGFRENTQFYIKRNVFSTKPGVIYGAMFVGREKGRTTILNDIIEKLNSCNLKVYKYILDAKTANGMEYDEVLDMVEKSACIIDIPKAGQSGLTLRVLESIFYSKKLITTNKNIIKEEFYNSQNIFVWDNPSEKEIKDFFQKPYEFVDEEIIKKYTIEQWVENFDK